jgi:hypothetical protein
MLTPTHQPEILLALGLQAQKSPRIVSEMPLLELVLLASQAMKPRRGTPTQPIMA